jgi:ATPase subunit of ABC transporter with duplicated ATPase domains
MMRRHLRGAGLRAYDGALLVVSHDAAFLQNVGVTRWIAPGAGAAV